MVQTCQRALPADEPGPFSLPWLRGIQRAVIEPSHIQPKLWRINPHCRLIYIESDPADHRTDARDKVFCFHSSICHKSDFNSQGHISPLIITQFYLALLTVFVLSLSYCLSRLGSFPISAFYSFHAWFLAQLSWQTFCAKLWMQKILAGQTCMCTYKFTSMLVCLTARVVSMSLTLKM